MKVKDLIESLQLIESKYPDHEIIEELGYITIRSMVGLEFTFDEKIKLENLGWSRYEFGYRLDIEEINKL